MTTAATDRFVFEARLRYDGERDVWSAIVPYEGSDADLQVGAQRTGVTAELREAREANDLSGAKPRRVRLRGDLPSLQLALAEYAARATRHGAYRI